MKPIAYLDLFCGMGGFSLGANRAGATSILAVDSWDEAIDVHRANFPKDPIRNFKLGMDHQIGYFETLTRRWKEKGYHVHIHGSPPCQALSNASTTDPSKGMPLVHWFLRLVYQCDPDSWSMENVVPVRKRLSENTPSVILNAADFGVPQTRRRCFAGHGWVAEATHSKEEWISVVEALPHLREELDNTSQSPQQLRLMLNSAGCGDSTSKGALTRDSPVEGTSKTIHNNRPSLRLVRLEALGSNAKRHQDREISKPSKTICGSGNQVGPRLFDHDHQKPKKIRSLTMSETLILQGFPGDFDLSAAKTQKSRWTMVGNAVCPPVAEAVIRGIQDDDLHG